MINDNYNNKNNCNNIVGVNLNLLTLCVIICLKIIECYNYLMLVLVTIVI